MATTEKLKWHPKCCGKISRHIFRVAKVNFSLADCVITDVTYRVFKNNANEGVYYTEDTIAKASLDPEMPLTIIIHGWLSNESTYWYEPFREELFKAGKHNLVFVDWHKSGSKMYDVAAANSKYIGGFIGDFILASKVNLKKVHLVGHSLGAQVAGFCGKRIYQRTCEKLGRITLTDPSALGFELPGVREDERVCEEDADFVDVIHTDIGHYGYIDPIGHVDFYPNGGNNQPGCPDLAEDDNCSHARSNLFFIESINSDRFKAAQCESWDHYLVGKYNQPDLITFGWKCPTTARGKYYFATNAEPPYAMG